MLLMTNKKGVIVNVALFGTIVVGYITVTLLTTKPQPRYLSFENNGMQAPLTKLGAGSILNPATLGSLSRTPPAATTTASTTTTTLSEFRGRPVLINLWASWCTACTAERAALEDLARAHKGSPVQMIGIATSDTTEAVARSGALAKTPYPQYLDGTGALAEAMGVKTLPQTFLIDSKGRILARVSQSLDPATLSALDKTISALEKQETAKQGRLPSFELDSSLGEKVTNATLADKVWVADFFFTSCPGLCPLMTAKMRTLQETFKGNPHFKLVSISVDPDVDTRDVLRDYQAKHSVDPKQWYFVRAEMPKLKQLAVDGFKLGSPDRPDFHSGRLVLVDSANRVRGYYDPESPQSLAALKGEIAQLLSN